MNTKSKLSEYEKCQYIRRVILNRAAEVMNYNWGDEFWGWDIRTKRGENHLGKILMRIREGLKD